MKTVFARQLAVAEQSVNVETVIDGVAMRRAD